MTDARDRNPTQQPETPRRRFLGALGALLGGMGVLALGRHLERRAARPRDLALKEADFYRRHDLAG